MTFFNLYLFLFDLDNSAFVYWWNLISLEQ